MEQNENQNDNRGEDYTEDIGIEDTVEDNHQLMPNSSPFHIATWKSNGGDIAPSEALKIMDPLGIAILAIQEPYSGNIQDRRLERRKIAYHRYATKLNMVACCDKYGSLFVDSQRAGYICQTGDIKSYHEGRIIHASLDAVFGTDKMDIISIYQYADKTKDLE